MAYLLYNKVFHKKLHENNEVVDCFSIKIEGYKLLLPDSLEKVPLFLPKQVDFWVILPVFYFEQEGLCIVVARFVFKGFDFGVEKAERSMSEAKEQTREGTRNEGGERAAVSCVMSEREWESGCARGLNSDSGKGKKRRISPLKWRKQGESRENANEWGV